MNPRSAHRSWLRFCPTSSPPRADTMGRFTFLMEDHWPRNTSTSRVFSRNGCRDGMRCARSRPTTSTTRVRASTCSTCSRTPQATFTWGMPSPTPTEMCSRATGATAAATCCTRSAGTPSGSPLRMRRSATASTRRPGPTRTSSSTSARCGSTPPRSTGIASSIRATRPITSGTSGCSSRCTRRGWRTGRTRRSTGARRTRRSSPTSRSSTAPASAAAPRS